MQSNKTIDIWIDALEKYPFETILIQPSPGKWSLGQVYMHIIGETEYFMGQVEYCLRHNDNTSAEMSDTAKQWFRHNAFPDTRMIRPEGLTVPEQPLSKDQLKKAMNTLKAGMMRLETAISNINFTGKTKHPGHDYFNAAEWFQWAEMHMRHHLRQKERIEAALNMVS